jgi:hypothetical protein
VSAKSVAALEVRAVSPEGTVLWLSVPTSDRNMALGFALEYLGNEWTVHLTGTSFSAIAANEITVLHTQTTDPHQTD